MALKDWKQEQKNVKIDSWRFSRWFSRTKGVANRLVVIKWSSKPKIVEAHISFWKHGRGDDLGYYIEKPTKSFPTKAKAIAFAKNYIRRH
jgi:hypothetical protein